MQAHSRKRRKLSASAQPDSEERVLIEASMSEEDDRSVLSASSDASGSVSDSSRDGSESNSDGERDSSAMERAAMREITFGALADAQASLSNTGDATRSRQHKGHATNSDSAKLSALKERLAELRARKSSHASRETATHESGDREKHSKTDRHAIQKRSSHHAPTEQSSSKPVRRFRPIVPENQIASNATLEDAAAGRARSKLDRDPRFSSVTTGNIPLDDARVRRNYAFLDEYRNEELASLRRAQAALPRNAGTEQRDRLRVEIERRANRERARQERVAEDEIVRQHRKSEREQIKAGKGAYWLKRGEVRDRAKEIAAKAATNADVRGRKRSQKDLLRRKEEKNARRDAKKLAKIRHTTSDGPRGTNRADSASTNMADSGALRRRAA